MYLCIRGIEFASFHDFAFVFWNNLVWYFLLFILFVFNKYLFFFLFLSPWYSWKIAELALSNNHSFTLPFFYCRYFASLQINFLLSTMRKQDLICQEFTYWNYAHHFCAKKCQFRVQTLLWRNQQPSPKVSKTEETDRSLTYDAFSINTHVLI